MSLLFEVNEYYNLFFQQSTLSVECDKSEDSRKNLILISWCLPLYQKGRAMQFAYLYENVSIFVQGERNRNSNVYVFLATNIGHWNSKKRIRYLIKCTPKSGKVVIQFASNNLLGV